MRKATALTMQLVRNDPRQILFLHQWRTALCLSSPLTLTQPLLEPPPFLVVDRVPLHDLVPRPFQFFVALNELLHASFEAGGCLYRVRTVRGGYYFVDVPVGSSYRRCQTKTECAYDEMVRKIWGMASLSRDID